MTEISLKFMFFVLDSVTVTRLDNLQKYFKNLKFIEKLGNCKCVDMLSYIYSIESLTRTLFINLTSYPSEKRSIRIKLKHHNSVNQTSNGNPQKHFEPEKTRPMLSGFSFFWFPLVRLYKYMHHIR